MSRNFFKMIFGFFTILAIVIGFTSIDHPIILKWLTGTAKIIGKPLNVVVYANGRINSNIKAFADDTYLNGKKINNYLLYLPDYGRDGKLKFISINLQEKWIGSPVGTGKNDYDFISKVLFQSEVGAHFIDFKNDIKGDDFDPQLTSITVRLDLTFRQIN